jgi:hypothetical protein
MGFGLKDVKNIFDRPKQGGASSKVALGLKADFNKSEGEGKDTYNIQGSDWFTAKPYGFKFYRRNEDKSPMVMFLPISPSNLTISTSFATNIVPTLYGTVEEHSDVRYFDIMIEGTTGFAPKYVDASYSTPNAIFSNKEKGRSAFSVAKGISLGGFFSKTLGTLNKLKEKATDLLDGGPQPVSGIDPEKSGYVAFHNLYRFFLRYKKDVSGVVGDTTQVRKKHPLVFFNYKDNNQYDVAIVNFSLRRSADNPMLYNYSIQLRGYNLKTVDSSEIKEDLNQRLAALGLDGVDGSSVLGDMKSLSNGAKAIVGAAVGGANILGR